MQTKIKTIDEIAALLKEDKNKGFKIVQCHGVFDLIHPGHIKHIEEAKKQGDKLVVTLTADRFVNKGPGRPFFNETLRSETLAALSAVDYVALNDTSDAVSCIKKIMPDIYVKGIEYADHEKDVTGKISEEVSAVEEVGGFVHYTNDIVFSSSSLINTFFDNSPEVRGFLNAFKKCYSIDELLNIVASLENLKVLVVGDAIIDEYQYVEPLGQSGKGLHMAAKLLDKELFLGGSLIIARHIAEFSSQVTLLTSIGNNCPHKAFIIDELGSGVRKEFIYLEDKITLTKRRYVLKDGVNLSKLFETYSSNEALLSEKQTNDVISYLEHHGRDFDLVIAADFGNGFTNTKIIDALSKTKAFLAVNTQTNSGNRGYNVVTNYKRADFISLNEPELRLAAHDRVSDLEDVMENIKKRINFSKISVTRGVKGVICFDETNQITQIPALTTHVIDRIGAGDSYLSLASMCLAKGCTIEVASFFGSIAAAIDVQIIGNREPVKKIPFCKFLTRLMK